MKRYGEFGQLDGRPIAMDCSLEELDNSIHNLLQLKDVQLRSKQSHWKIECDALSLGDWKTLAFLAAEILPPFSRVEGVPTGGLIFADLLRDYATEDSDRLVIADDVLTSGQSMEDQRDGRYAIGIVAFSRGRCPDWVESIFQVNEWIE